MLRRPPTAIQLTTEDILAYDDKKNKDEMNVENDNTDKRPKPAKERIMKSTRKPQRQA
jgi:hypothetical protein